MFLQHANVYGNNYGIYLDQVKEAIKNGKICFLKLSVEGAKQVFQSGLSCNFLFVAPPVREVL
jgi:guanylate kinase